MLSTACLEELFGSSREGILLLGTEGAVLWSNAIAADFLGTDHHSLSGQNFLSALIEASPAVFERPEELRGLLQQAEKKSGPIETPCHILAGITRRERWLQCSVQHLHFGELTGKRLLRFREAAPVLPASASVENRKKNAALPSVFRILFDSVPDPLWHISAQRKVLDANPAALATVAGTAEAVGRDCFSIFRQRRLPCEGCPVEQSRISGRPETVQICTGNERTVQVRAFPLPAQAGESSGFLIHERDLTEHLRLRELAFQTMPLASLGELAAGVAHEINNPATGIINCAQLLVDRLESGNREIAQRILREGERVSVIVRNLLSLARVGAEKNPGVRVEEELQDLLSLTQAQLRKERIILVLRLDPDLPAVTANSQHIRQVFLNLINNARYALNQKYPGVSKGKILEIHGEKRAEGGVRFTFHDCGTGIPQTVLPKIFRPFFTTKPVGKGTGLGLSISHSIIVDHGGTLEIESVEGKFTRAIIQLPSPGSGRPM